MKKRNQTGFTLYELMITLLIVGVVLSYGIPNMAEFTANSRITSTSNDLHAAFQMARSESARAKANITICASADPLAADSNCDGTWNQGYIVFVDDTVGDDLNRAGATETVLRAHGPIAEGVSLAIANDATYFSYASSGLGRGNVGGNVALSQAIICDKRGTTETSTDFSAARLFVTTPLGRATVVRDLTTVDDALTAMGKNCP
jgi:type IV fimbrial biogenesis protein FimT